MTFYRKCLYNTYMEKPVALKISNRGMRFETLGTMNETDECVAFTFEADDAHFVLSAYDGHLTVIRCGEENYEFDIVEGRKTDFLTGTPFGPIPMHIGGDRVAIKRGVTTELLVKYHLGLAGERENMQLHIKAIPQV